MFKPAQTLRNMVKKSWNSKKLSLAKKYYDQQKGLNVLYFCLEQEENPGPIVWTE